ncbi:MAG: hypothetical protein A3G71_05700 [Gammaproteobacteria bacterium RIFCSPLOWO2_12_FULL_38_14]|nr:MAG: hypothetical protein A3G71_05700 [Gammaproteobacteria bacterium RIFCSPLOWO2_12_FULL_38_14]
MKKPLAVITGAGTGIGKALALELLEKGIAIFAVGRRISLLKNLQKIDPKNIFILSSDVRKPAGRKKIVDTLPSSHTLRYLIHNAGIVTPVGSLKTLKLKTWRDAMQINVEAPLFLTQSLLPKMKEGRILHISSGAAHFPIIHFTAYCASKAALHMIYQCLNLELKKIKIAIGSVAPGIIDTPMQNIIRSFPKKQFPDVDEFKGFKKNKKLISPEVCAKKLSDLLLNTPLKSFSKKEWWF